jgi:hypothetical protein
VAGVQDEVARGRDRWRLRLSLRGRVLLGEIHFGVGGFEQGFGGVAVFGEDGEADAGTGVKFGTEDVGGFSKLFGEAVHDGGELAVGAYFIEDDDKLIPAEARNGFASSCDGAQTGCDYEEELIAGIVAEGIVDLFELVEIEEEDSDGALDATSSVDGLGELGHEESAVGEAGEGVVVGEMLKLVGGLNLAGHIILDANEVGDSSCVIANGGEVKLIPEERSILAVVAQNDAGVGAFREGPANLGNGGLVSIGALEESAISSADFGGGVAGHALEGGVDVGEGKVGIVGVGDGDAVTDGIEDASAVCEIVDHGEVPQGERPRHGGCLFEQGGSGLEAEGTFESEGGSESERGGVEAGGVRVADAQERWGVVEGEAAAVARGPGAGGLVGNDDRRHGGGGGCGSAAKQVDGAESTDKCGGMDDVTFYSPREA